MTKSKFFAMLDKYLSSHNEWAKFETESDKYTPAQLESYVFHEDPEKLKAWKEKDPSYPWTSHASGFTLADCWHVEVMQHKTAEAAEKQNKIFTRWIAEYKTMKEVKTEEKPEITDCFVIDNSDDVVILEIGSIFEGVIGVRSGFDSVEDAEQWAKQNNIAITGEAGDYSYLCK